MKDSRSPDPATAPVGARHDDSSLFTLDALKKTEDEARNQKKSDDSGLIDLKALAAIAKERPQQPDIAVSSVVAPPDLFSIAAPVAPMIAPPITTAAPEIEQPKPNRTKLFVGVGAAVAVLAAVAAFAATRGPDPAAAAPSVTAVASPPPVATAAPQPEEPRIAAVNPGERPAPPKEDPKPAVTATAAPAPRAVTAARGPLPKAPKEEAPAAPPKPPADACDLACQMQRAVNKKK